MLGEGQPKELMLVGAIPTCCLLLDIFNELALIDSIQLLRAL
jgi:hypothetical protein